MSEIKFRAWDGTAMIYEMCMDVDIGSSDGQTFKVNFHTWPNYEFMQYTGLTDKNGVEIYEGDMVKYKMAFRFGEDDALSDGEYFEDYTDVVKFEGGEFYPRPLRHDIEDSWYSYGIFEMEIIGNIHEGVK